MLSPVSGSAGFRSSVFLSSCAPAEPADRRRPGGGVRQAHRSHGDCRFGAKLAAFARTDNNPSAALLSTKVNTSEKPQILPLFAALIRNQPKHPGLFEANQANYISGETLNIRAGYDIAFECYQDVPMVLLLSVHPSREKDLLMTAAHRAEPGSSARQGLDPFGNIWTRFLAPAGRLKSAPTS